MLKIAVKQPKRLCAKARERLVELPLGWINSNSSRLSLYSNVQLGEQNNLWLFWCLRYWTTCHHCKKKNMSQVYKPLHRLLQSPLRCRENHSTNTRHHKNLPGLKEEWTKIPFGYPARVVQIWFKFIPAKGGSTINHISGANNAAN